MVMKLLFLFLLIALCKGFHVKKLKLQQILIFSRHNVRTPLGKELDRYSPKPWPKVDWPYGHLTPRGALLEGYMGEYFSQWLNKEEFLPEGCPGEDTVYAFANSKSRTKATARAFLDSAFVSCNVTVHHSTEKPDPLFAPVIHNSTEAYQDMVLKEIQRKLHNNWKLKAAFTELNKILDIKKSDICRKDLVCDLTTAKNNITFVVGEEVWGNGPLFIGNSAMDSFLMNYYNGLPSQDIAWGLITTPENWNTLTEISRQDQDIRYSTVAEDIAAPLMKNLTKIFKNYKNMPKLLLIVGHDYNMNSVGVSLGLKSKVLPNQYEKYPIGGKYVFQRWTDGEKDYLKIEYVYASWSQLRNATKLSLETPPERVVMELNWCKTDRKGFCSWNEFVYKL